MFRQTAKTKKKTSSYQFYLARAFESVSGVFKVLSPFNDVCTIVEQGIEALIAMSVLRPTIQVSDAGEFFHAAASIFYWDDLADQVIMDIGCGHGNSSMTFATSFPALKRLIAIDSIPGMLDEAKQKNPHPKIEYEQADIMNKYTLARWFGEVDIALSIFCFNCLTDQKQGYENLFHLLRPNGEAAILQSLYSNYYDFLKDLSGQPKWSSYTDTIGVLIPESHYQKYSTLHYRQLFEEIGFEIVRCTDETRSYNYTSDTECSDAIFQSCPLSVAIPDERKEEFKLDLFETFLKYHERNKDGLLCMTYVTLSVLLRKPGDSSESE